MWVREGVAARNRRLLSWMESQGVYDPSDGFGYAYEGGRALEPGVKSDVERAIAMPLHHGYGMTEYAV